MNQDMNQETMGGQDFFAQSPFQPIKNAKYYRAVARQKLRSFWGIAILVAFLAMLLGGIGGFSLNLDFDQTQTEQVDETAVQQIIDAAMVGNWEPLVEFMGISHAQADFFLTLLTVLLIAAVVTSIAFWIFVSSPIKVGYRRFQLELIDGNAQNIRVATLFGSFKKGYFKSIGLNVLHALIQAIAFIPLIVATAIGLVQFLAAWHTFESWPSLLLGALAFAGIVFVGAIGTMILSFPLTYMYTYSYMIMAEYPQVGVVDALRQSRHLMRGRKWKLFCLDISFIGWYLLAAIFTFGIGTIVVTPYNEAARAAFYHDITNREAAAETEFPSIDPLDYQTGPDEQN